MSFRYPEQGLEIVRGYRNLARYLRTSEARIHDLINRGAPIALDARVPRAEKAELWDWYKRYCNSEAACAYVRILPAPPELPARQACPASGMGSAS